MQISEAGWSEYVKRLAQIDEKAGQLMQVWIDANGLDDLYAAARYAYSLVSVYGEAAAALACEMYDTAAEASGKVLPPAEPAPTATFEETATAVRGTVSNRHNSVPDTVSRLTKQAAADTTLQNARRDGAQFAWVPHGDTCAFCIMLASNGWQNVSKKALRNGHAEHIHAHCDCEYAVRFDDHTTVAGYDPDRYYDMYRSAEGSTWEEKVNSMRREQYARNKEYINGQKRAAYQERKDTLKSLTQSVSGTVVTNSPRKPEKPVYGCNDVTQDWLNHATPNSHPVEEITAFTQDGVSYTVDGRSVKLDYSKHEKEIAELLESTLGGEIYLMPRVEYPKSVETPDYLFKGERLDLKTMSNSTSKNAVYNRLNEAQGQASSFVLDISGNSLGSNEIVRQANEIFQSYHTRGIKCIIIVEDGEIISILKRK